MFYPPSIEIGTPFRKKAFLGSGDLPSVKGCKPMAPNLEFVGKKFGRILSVLGLRPGLFL